MSQSRTVRRLAIEAEAEIDNSKRIAIGSLRTKFGSIVVSFITSIFKNNLPTIQKPTHRQF
jgi:hypothetical protein